MRPGRDLPADRGHDTGLRRKTYHFSAPIVRADPCSPSFLGGEIGYDRRYRLAEPLFAHRSCGIVNRHQSHTAGRPDHVFGVLSIPRDVEKWGGGGCCYPAICRNCLPYPLRDYRHRPRPSATYLARIRPGPTGSMGQMFSPMISSLMISTSCSFF